VLNYYEWHALHHKHVNEQEQVAEQQTCSTVVPVVDLG